MLNTMASDKRQPDMKTLIISGYYTVPDTNSIKVSDKVTYNVTLYGQTDEKPLVQCITWFIKELNGYDELERVCREKFCQYFGTDLNNIISCLLYTSPSPR